MKHQKLYKNTLRFKTSKNSLQRKTVKSKHFNLLKMSRQEKWFMQKIIATNSISK